MYDTKFFIDEIRKILISISKLIKILAQAPGYKIQSPILHKTKKNTINETGDLIHPSSRDVFPRTRSNIVKNQRILKNVKY